MFKVGDFVSVKPQYISDGMENIWQVTDSDAHHELMNVRNVETGKIHIMVKWEFFLFAKKKEFIPPKNELEFLDRVKQNFRNGV